MHFPRRKTLLAIGAATMLAIGATSIALAQDPGTGDSGARSGAHHQRAGVVIGLHQVIQASGLDQSVFREGFQDGLSVNDILEANGLDPAAIHAEVLANLEARLAEKVAAGEMTQERADEILANASDKLTRLMAHVPDGDGLPRPFLQLLGARGILESAAETIGITVEALRGEIRDTDGTIATVATAHGVDPQDVIDNAVAKAEAKIAELEAEGRITAERAAEMRANAAERITTIVNEGFGQGGPNRP